MAPVVVQSKAVPDSLTGTFTSPTTAGNTVVVCVGTENSSNVAISISGITLGGAADNFAQVPGATVQSGFSGATEFSAVWADPNCAGGQTTVVISGSNLNIAAATDNGWVMYEVSGLLSTTSVATLTDKASTNSGTTGTAVSSGTTAATTQASEIAFAATASQNAQSSFSAGYTVTGINDGSGVFNVGAFQVLSSTGAQSFTATQSASGPWAAAVCTFKAASSTITGSGGVSLASMGAGGSGTAAVAGSGGVSLASMAAAGSGTAAVAGSGGVSLASVAAAGSGSVTAPALLISIASTGGTDPRTGTAYKSGMWLYGTGGGAAGLRNAAGQPQLQLVPASVTQNTTVPQLFASSLNAGAAGEQTFSALLSGKENSLDDAGLQLFSEAADGSAAASAVLEFGGAPAATVTKAGAAFSVPVQPGNGSTPGARVYSGSGAPALSGTAGDLYIRSNGGAGTYLYRCTGGSSWTAFA